MFTLDGIRQFHSWTHSSLTRLLDHIATLSEEHYFQKLNGFGIPTLGEQVIHIFQCESSWMHSLQAIPFGGWTAKDWPTVSAARVLQQETCQGTLTYLAGLTDKQLNERVELCSPGGDLMVEMPAHVVHHVLTHAFHHKGQIVSMCRILGHPAPDTDML